MSSKHINSNVTRSEEIINSPELKKKKVNKNGRRITLLKKYKQTDNIPKANVLHFAETRAALDTSAVTALQVCITGVGF